MLDIMPISEFVHPVLDDTEAPFYTSMPAEGAFDAQLKAIPKDHGWRKIEWELSTVCHYLATKACLFSKRGRNDGAGFYCKAHINIPFLCSVSV